MVIVNFFPLKFFVTKISCLFLFCAICVPIRFFCYNSNNSRLPASFTFLKNLITNYQQHNLLWLLLSYFCPFAFRRYFTQLFYYFLKYLFVYLFNFIIFLSFRISSVFYSVVLLLSQIHIRTTRFYCMLFCELLLVGEFVGGIS